MALDLDFLHYLPRHQALNASFSPGDVTPSGALFMLGILLEHTWEGSQCPHSPGFRLCPSLPAAAFGLPSIQNRVLCKDRVLPDNRNCCTPSHPDCACTSPTVTLLPSTAGNTDVLELLAQKAHQSQWKPTLGKPQLDYLCVKQKPSYLFSLSCPNYWCTKIGFTGSGC